MKIGFVTTAELARYFPSQRNPLITHDDQALADYLNNIGIEVVPILWGTSGQALHSLGLTCLLMRSPWDYAYSPEQSARFVEWIKSINDEGMLMVNPPSLMLWNIDKRYLFHLAKRGVPIVPTKLVEPCSSFNFRRHFVEEGPFVVKPTIGAGAKDLRRFLSMDEVDIYAPCYQQERRAFLVQPYASDIVTLGEWSLVYFGRTYSHAVLKRPGRNQWLVQDELGGSVESAHPPEAVLSVGDVAMQSLDETPVYARVDIIHVQGSYAVSELELLEPELFFLSRMPDGHRINETALELFCQRLTAAIFRNR